MVLSEGRPRAGGFLGTAWDLKRAEWSGTTGVQRRQRARLDALLAHAREHSAFYARHYATTPSSELSSLPPVSKAALMDQFDGWVTDPRLRIEDLRAFVREPSRVGEPWLGRYTVWTTSGSSGEPAVLVHDPGSMATIAAMHLVRGLLAWSSPLNLARKALRRVRGADREAGIYVVGAHTPAAVTTERRRRISPRLAEQLRVLSAAQPLPDLVAALNRFGPNTLSSYPSALDLLAEEASHRRLSARPAQLVSAGETLGEAARERIEAALGVPVRQHYSTAETGPIAFECRRGWLHVNEDWVILEAVDESLRPIPEGEPSHSVLVTNLANRVQPVIRYQLSDSVTFRTDRCECGRSFAALRLEGRTDETLVVDGLLGPVKLLPRPLVRVVLNSPGVRRCQIVQLSPSSLEVRIEPEEGVDAGQAWIGVELRLRSFLAAHSAPAVSVSRGADPPKADPRTGKFRFVTLQRPRG